MLKSAQKSYQVWADGKRSVERSSRWIWNFWTPFMPSKVEKPCRGTLLVPVTNWRKLALSAWSKERKARQNHWICQKQKYSIIRFKRTSGDRHFLFRYIEISILRGSIITRFDCIWVGLYFEFTLLNEKCAIIQLPVMN